MNPLISIITVTFNAGRVLPKTIESLKNQTYQDFEWVVVDGNSIDNTIDLAKNSGLKLTNLLSEPDKGLYDAMNKGLRRAKGKYIIFLNAGDALHDGETLKLYAEEALKDMDIIYGNTNVVNLEGKYIGPRHLKAPEKLTKNSFSKGMLICHQAFMVKKELAPEYNLLYKFSSDYDWCVKCISKTTPCNCINLNKVTIDYLREGLTSSNKWESLRERFRIMTMHYGLTCTLFNHLYFLFRALSRGHL